MLRVGPYPTLIGEWTGALLIWTWKIISLILTFGVELGLGTISLHGMTGSSLFGFPAHASIEPKSE